MTEVLGYPRFAAQGGDWGASVAARLGVAHPEKLLGIHVIGEQASELIHLGLAAMLMDAGWDLLNQVCFNYPTLGEAYKYAAYDGLQALQQRSRA